MSHLLEVELESFARSMGNASLNEFLGELHRGTHARQVTAHFRQEQHAREWQGAVGVDGLGAPEMVIDATAFHFWGARLGYECWDDPTFCREMMRDNPAMKVKTAPAKTTIVNQWGDPAREAA